MFERGIAINYQRKADGHLQKSRPCPLYEKTYVQQIASQTINDENFVIRHLRDQSLRLGADSASTIT